MKPEDSARNDGPKIDVPATPPPIAEPPKSLQFTEVPSENQMPAASAHIAPAPEQKPEVKPAEVPKAPEKEAEKKPDKKLDDADVKGIVPSVQPPKVSPVKAAKKNGSQQPVAMLSVATILFLVLAAVAYLAYTKSQ
jgi:hypothetical protein